jgi:competence protein ComGC
MTKRSIIRRHMPSAFTLTEVMVLLTVIVVLLSIIVPAIGQARQTARTYECKTRLKQHGIEIFTLKNDTQWWPICRISSTVPDTQWTPGRRKYPGGMFSGDWEIMVRDYAPEGERVKDITHAAKTNRYLCPSSSLMPNETLNARIYDRVYYDPTSQRAMNYFTPTYFGFGAITPTNYGTNVEFKPRRSHFPFMPDQVLLTEMAGYSPGIGDFGYNINFVPHQGKINLLRLDGGALDATREDAMSFSDKLNFRWR